MSPRKQSLLGELDRAPADRRSRFGLRRLFFEETSDEAAYGGVGGRREEWVG